MKFKWPSLFKSAYDVEAEGRVPQVLDKVPNSVDVAEQGSYVTENNSVNTERAVQTYCFNPDVYAVVNLKAKMLSSLPMKIFSVKPSGNKEEIVRGALYDLINNPNPKTTKTQLIQQFASWYYLTGHAYIVLEEILGERYLICLNSQFVRPVVIEELGMSGIVYTKGSKTFYYSDDQVLAWRNFSPNDDFYGMSPVQPLADDVQARRSTMRNIKYHYARGGISGGVLKTDNNLDEGELRKLKKDWENRKTDSARLIILPDGWEFQEIKGSENSSQPEDVLTYTLASVCNAFGVPVALLSPDKNTHPTESEVFLWTSQLFPDADTLQELFTMKFGVSNNRQQIVMLMERNNVAVMQQFEVQKTRTRAADLASGYSTINDWRELEDKPLVDSDFANTPRPEWDQKNAVEMAEQQARLNPSPTGSNVTLPNDPGGRDQTASGEKPIGVDASGRK